MNATEVRVLYLRGRSVPFVLSFYPTSVHVHIQLEAQNTSWP